MAERIKDAEDRLLESMFESLPVADDGFSVKVVGKIRRRLWLRRLTLPVAASIGGVIAFKPLASLVSTLASFTSFVPNEYVNTAASSLPQLQMLIMGAMLLAVCLLGLRTLED
ncbi:MAG: hypothetical protein K0U72_09510 [Gammaproteobacteria bacterium]|nr:hypothetical protein [Gammaproteobacteria bacterium]